MGRRHKHKRTNKKKSSTVVATETTHSSEPLNEPEASGQTIASASKVPDDKERSKTEGKGSTTGSFGGFRRGFLNVTKTGGDEEPKQKRVKTEEKKVEESHPPTSETLEEELKETANKTDPTEEHMELLKALKVTDSGSFKTVTEEERLKETKSLRVEELAELDKMYEAPQGKESAIKGKASDKHGFAGLSRGFLNSPSSKRSGGRHATEKAKTVTHKSVVEEIVVTNDPTDKEVADSRTTVDKTDDVNCKQSKIIKDEDSKRKNFGGLSSAFLNVRSTKRSRDTEKSEPVSTYSEAQPVGTCHQGDKLKKNPNKMEPSEEDMAPNVTQLGSEAMFKAMVENLVEQAGAKEQASKAHKKVKDQCMGLEELQTKVRQNEKLMKYFKDEELKQRFAQFKTCSDEVLKVQDSTDPVDVKCRDLLEELGNFLNEHLPETT